MATQIFCIFTPKIGEDEPNLTIIFFRWVETNQQPVSLSEGHGPSNGAIIFSGFLSGTSGVKPEDVQLCGVATPNCIAWSESDRADLDGFHVL